MSIHSEAVAIIQTHGDSLCSDKERLSIGYELEEKKVAHAVKAYAKSAEPDDVVCMIDDSILQNGGSGFLFTSNKLYRSAFPFKPKKIWYDEIEDASVIFADETDSKPVGVNLKMSDGSAIRVVSSYVDAQVLAVLLGALKENTTAIQQAEIPLPSFPADADFAATALAVNVADYQEGNRLYDQEKLHARQGHGFAAEQANNLIDQMHGKEVIPQGDDFKKDGPDRIVDGTWIQSKYCSTGEACIDNCFADDGTFRYFDKNGKPMVVEVPKDDAIYQKAVERMEKRILEGKVPGITDAAEASNIVKQGNVTYQQAKNIAKAGNVDSILYDSANGLVTCLSAFGISAAIVFATSIWNNDPPEVAIRRAAYQGLKIGGSTFVASVLASQLSKAGLNSMLVGSSEAIVNFLGPKASAVIVNALRSGKDIYGAAAMKSAAKLLRGNVITATLTVTVLSAFDIADIFRGRISGAQLFKNITGTTSAVAGGTAGWIGGAALGSAILPGAGTVVGSVVGSMLAGALSGKAASMALGQFIEDDANEMVSIIQTRFQNLSEDYLLNRSEAEKVVDALSAELDGNALKKMYASDDKEKFADELLIPLIEDRVGRRPHIYLPEPSEVDKAIRTALEDIAEEAERTLADEGE